MMRVNQINSQESAITIGCGFFYYLFKDYRELVCFEITQCDWLMFATDVFERLSINRAWGEHKMCWTLHFKKFWGWNRHRSLSQSCRISSRINELPWLPIYHYRFSHIFSAEHDVCAAPRSMDWKCILRQVATSPYQIEMKCHCSSEQCQLTTPSAVTSEVFALLWLNGKHCVIGMQRSKFPDQMWSAAWERGV